MTLRPASPEEVGAAVRGAAGAGARLLPRGGGSKPALSTPAEGVASLDLSGLSGVLEYAPEEYTFTALAGTRVAAVADLLAERGQYLPFDPLLAPQGATLGGTVAAGANGPGRQRYGGVRDFLLAARFVDGAGSLVRGGAKVVKNAAGFDLPKLLVGSIGRLAVLVELTFKVFPAPEAYATLAAAYPGLDAALADVVRLAASPLELHALDLEPAGTSGWTLWARLGGLAEALPARITRLRDFLLAPGGGAMAAEVVAAPADEELWQRVKGLDWVPPGRALVKIPLTPRRIPALEARLARLHGVEARRRYSAGGQVAWLAWPVAAADPWTAELDALLRDLDLSGLALLGPPGPVRLGVDPGAPLACRVKRALDPHARFLDL